MISSFSALSPNGVALLSLQLCLAFLPVILLFILVTLLPRERREATGVFGLEGNHGRFFLHIFAIGALLALPATFLSIPLREWCEALPPSPLASGLGRAFIAAAIPEEGVKFLALCFVVPLVMRRVSFAYMPLVAGATVGLGFVLVENIFYLKSGSSDLLGNMMTALVRALTALPCHVFLGAVMGYYLGAADWVKSPAQRFLQRLFALILPIFLHGLYDLPLLFQGASRMSKAGDASDDGMVLALLVLAWMAAWTWHKLGRLNKVSAPI